MEDRRDWSAEDQREALLEPPDGHLYTCAYCGGDMTDDEAVYDEPLDAFVCKLCGSALT